MRDTNNNYWGLSCHSWSFHTLLTEGKMSLESFIKLCADLGFDGVEIQDVYFKNTRLDYLKSVSKLIQSSNLKLVALDISNDFLAPGKLDFGLRAENEIERVKKWIEIAPKLNTHIVRLSLGFKPDDMSDGQAFDRVRASLNKCLPYAEKHEVYLAPEPFPTYPAQDPAAVLTLLKVINSKFFRICLDFGWFPPDWKYEAMKLLIPYTVHVHAKASMFDKKGEDIWTDFGRVLSMLKEAHYAGFISAEYEGPAINFEERVKRIKDNMSLIQKYM